MRRHPKGLALGFALLSALAGPVVAAPEVVASFDDPAGDASGPGSYLPPGDTGFQEGDFDLRRFSVLEDGEDVLFEVTLGAPIRTPDVTQRSNSSPLQLWNGIYLQNVDIYLDTDPGSPAGSSACIPGRRVGFADGRTWKAAVVLTPQPGPARTIVRDALGPAAANVLFPTGLVVRGRTIVARVPAAELGGRPRQTWGYSVQVSGARWERSFAVSDRLRGTLEPDAFTMPVLSLPEAWAFGGAPEGQVHPRVVDVLLPPGVDQGTALGSYVVATRTFAQVPFVYAVPPPRVSTPTASPTATPTASPTATPTASPTATPTATPAGTATSSGTGTGRATPDLAGPGTGPLTVADVSAEIVSIRGPTSGLRPWQLGRVLSADGATVARVVVIQVMPGGLVANAVEGRDRIERGARVAFDGP